MSKEQQDLWGKNSKLLHATGFNCQTQRGHSWNSIICDNGTERMQSNDAWCISSKRNGERTEIKCFIYIFGRIFQSDMTKPMLEEVDTSSKIGCHTGKLIPHIGMNA